MPKVSVIEIGVIDMDQAMAFYEALGLEVAAKPFYPHFVELRHSASAQPGAAKLILALKDRLVADPYSDGTQTLLGLEVESLAAFAEAAQSHGVTFVHAQPQAFPVGILNAVRDPFGNVIEIIEYRFA